MKWHKTYPYLLGGWRVDRPNQAWCADITYLPMRRGFLYLVEPSDPLNVALPDDLFDRRLKFPSVVVGSKDDSWM